jgi:thymidine kinase
MFSGKSSEMIRRIRRVRVYDRFNVLVVKHKIDTRYEHDYVCSHNLDKEKCIPLHQLSDVIDHPAYSVATHVFVEEAQFFQDLFDVVLHMVKEDKKHVTVVGLNGSCQQELIGQVHQLLPKADDVVFLKALCSHCTEPREAAFTKRLATHDGKIFVGGRDKYEAVCREHL